MTSAGKLRHRVTFQQPDGLGSSITDDSVAWVDVVTRAAAVRPVSVKEIYAADGFLGLNDLVVTVRYDPALAEINNTWRLWFDNKLLYVVGMINPDHRNRWLNISTTREVADMRVKNTRLNPDRLFN